MQRSLIFGTLLASSLLLSPAPATSPQLVDATAAPPLTSSCPNKIAREPVLIFDVSGGSFGGPSHRRLAVYSDGFASTSRSFLGTSSADTAILPSEVVDQLRFDLAQAGASQMCDGKFIPVPDTPITTVTVMRGTTDARSHTFSYFAPNAGQLAISILVNDFLTTHFPGS